MKFPQDCRYTKEHEWIKVEGDVGTVGITEHAQKELGDVVFVELPKVGVSFNINQPFGNVESVKAVSDIFCPVSGEVVEINETLLNSPELVNSDPHGAAWFVKLRISKAEELQSLLTAKEYEDYVTEESGE